MTLLPVLDIDVGNSFLKWRCGERRGRLLTAELREQDFLCAIGGADSGSQSQQVGRLVAERAPARVRLASVATQAQQHEIARWCLQHWGVVAEVAETTAHCAGVSNSYAEPQRMGVDRWLAMLAAYNTQGACCVVDCGSAITVDFVDQAGQHLGGYIMPGAYLLKTGLMANTRRIGAPLTALDWRGMNPGRSTDEAVDHGLALMLDALAARVVASCAEQLGQQASLLITGGDAENFQRAAGQGKLEPDLVLDGLGWMFP